LGKEMKIRFKPEGVSYLGSFLIGVTLQQPGHLVRADTRSILLLAGTKTSVLEGARLLSAYSWV